MVGGHIEIILIVTGASTALAFVQFMAPSALLRRVGGAAPADLVSTAVARH